MVVYVLMCNQVCDGDNCTSVIGVFNTIELAKEMLELEIKQAQKDFEGTLYCEEKNDMDYSIWRMGEYLIDHCDLIISPEIVLDGIAK